MRDRWFERNFIDQCWQSRRIRRMTGYGTCDRWRAGSIQSTMAALTAEAAPHPSLRAVRQTAKQSNRARRKLKTSADLRANAAGTAAESRGALLGLDVEFLCQRPPCVLLVANVFGGGFGCTGPLGGQTERQKLLFDFVPLQEQIDLPVDPSITNTCVAAGATTANHPFITTPETCSFIEGRSGKLGKRDAEVTARRRNLPA